MLRWHYPNVLLSVLLGKTNPALYYMHHQRLDPSCRLCPANHVLAVCPALTDTRKRLYPKLMNTVLHVQPSCDILAANPLAHLSTPLKHTVSPLTKYWYKVFLFLFHTTGAMLWVMPDQNYHEIPVSTKITGIWNVFVHFIKQLTCMQQLISDIWIHLLGYCGNRDIQPN